MGDIQVSMKFASSRYGDYEAACNGWAYVQGGAERPSLSDFDAKVRDEMMAKSKKKAKELNANAIIGLNIEEGSWKVWKCHGTAARVLKWGAKKESSSEDGNNNVGSPPAKKMKPAEAPPGLE